VVLIVRGPFVEDHWVSRLQLEDPLSLRALYLNEDNVLVKVDVAVFLNIKIQAVLQREPRELYQLRKLACFEFSVVLLDEVFFGEMWMKAPKADTFIRNVLQPGESIFNQCLEVRETHFPGHHQVLGGSDRLLVNDQAHGNYR
jgi:hypothetical protein